MAENILSISLKDYKKQIEELKGTLLNLQRGSEAYDKVLNEVQNRQNKLNQVMSDTKGKTEAAEGSVKEMRQVLSELKKAWVETGDEMERKQLANQIKPLQDKLNDLHKSIGDYRYNIGNYANSFAEALNKMGISFGGVIQGAMETGSAINKAFAKNPYITAFAVAISAIVAVFRLFKSGLDKNKDAQEKWNKAMATFKPIISAVNKLINKLVVWIVDLAETIADWVVHSNKAFRNFSMGAESMVNGVIHGLNTLMKGMLALPKFMTNIFTSIGNIAVDAVGVITRPLVALLDAVGADEWAERLRNVPNVIKGVLNNANKYVQDFKVEIADVHFGESMADGFDKMTKSYREQAQARRDAVDAENAIDDSRLATNEKISDYEKEIADYRVKAANAKTEKERQEALKHIKQTEQDIAKARQQQAKFEYETYKKLWHYSDEEQKARSEGQAVYNRRTDEQLQKLSELRREMLDADTDMYMSWAKVDSKIMASQKAEASAAQAAANASAAARKKAEAEAKKAEAERIKQLKEQVKLMEVNLSYYKEESLNMIKMQTAMGTINDIEARKKELEVTKEILEKRRQMIDTLKGQKGIEVELAQMELQFMKENSEYRINLIKTEVDEISGLYKKQVDNTTKTLDDFNTILARKKQNALTIDDFYYGTLEQYINSIKYTINQGFGEIRQDIDLEYQTLDDYFRKYGKRVYNGLSDVTKLYLKGVDDIEREIKKKPLSFIFKKLDDGDEAANEANFNESLIKIYAQYSDFLNKVLELNEKSKTIGVDFLKGFDLTENGYDLNKLLDHVTLVFSRIGEGYTEGEKKTIKELKTSLADIKAESKPIYDDFVKEFRKVDVTGSVYSDDYIKGIFGTQAIKGVLLKEYRKLKSDITSEYGDLQFQLGDMLGITLDDFDDGVIQMVKHINEIPNALKPAVVNLAVKVAAITKSYIGNNPIYTTIFRELRGQEDEMHKLAIDDAERVAQIKRDTLNKLDNDLGDLKKQVDKKVLNLNRDIAGQVYDHYVHTLNDLKDSLPENIQRQIADVYKEAIESNDGIVDVEGFVKKLQNIVQEIGNLGGDYAIIYQQVMNGFDKVVNASKNLSAESLTLYLSDIMGIFEQFGDKIPEEAKEIVDQLEINWGKVLMEEVDVYEFKEQFGNSIDKISGIIQKEVGKIKVEIPPKVDLTSVIDNIYNDLGKIRNVVGGIDFSDIIKSWKDQLAKAPEELRPEIEKMVELWENAYINEQQYYAKRQALEEEYKYANEEITRLQAANVGEDNEEYKAALARREEFLNAMLALDSDYAEKQKGVFKDIANNGVSLAKKEKKRKDDEVKNYFELAKSIGTLMGNISEIFEEYINERVKQGKITEEQAKKEFETVKALQIAEATISTIAGATQAFMQTWGDKTIQPTWLKAALAVTNAASVTAAGVANIAKIAHTEYGSASASGAASATAGMTSAIYQGVTADPLLNETLDERNLSQLDIETRSTKEQRVYILQSDISDSESQVRIRQNQSTF